MVYHENRTNNRPPLSSGSHPLPKRCRCPCRKNEFLADQFEALEITVSEFEEARRERLAGFTPTGAYGYGRAFVGGYFLVESTFFSAACDNTVRFLFQHRLPVPFERFPACFGAILIAGSLWTIVWRSQTSRTLLFQCIPSEAAVVLPIRKQSFQISTSC